MNYYNQYIWPDKYGEMRVITRLEDNEELDKLICFNSLNTGQAVEDNTEMYLQPVQIYNNPFVKKTNHIKPNIILCELINKNNKPHSGNERLKSIKTLENYEDINMKFKMDFFLTKKNIPIAFLSQPAPTTQGIFYCGVGGDIAIGQECASEAFLNASKADINVTTFYGSIAPSQWCVELSGTAKVKLLDDLLCLRYIISKTAEKFGITICYHPQLLKEEWNGSACLIEFSNDQMRNDTNCNYIRNTVIKNLEKTHNEYIPLCGEDNNKRLLGTNNTSKHETFTSGIGDYDCSIRIPSSTNKNGKGTIEDRRPGANIDPYKVVPHLINSCFNH